MSGTVIREADKAMRDHLGSALVKLGGQRPDLVVLDADVSSSTRTGMFGAEYPERFFNVGVAEANLADVAAGLATAGFRPVISTFALFLALKSTDQIRNVICYNNLPVVIVGGYAGLSDSFDGASHQSITDIAVMRALPNLRVVVPGSGEDLESALEEALSHDGPTYIRACRNPMPSVESDVPFETGRGRILKDGSDCTVIAAGIPVPMALEAAAAMEEEGVSVRVVEMPTIKPLDEDLIVECAGETGAVVTVEEHNVIGGLGSAVAQAVVRKQPVPMGFVGVNDRFTESGPYDALLVKYGISKESIMAEIRLTANVRK